MIYAFYFLGTRAVKLPGVQRIAAAATLAFSAPKDFAFKTYNPTGRAKKAFGDVASFINTNMFYDSVDGGGNKMKASGFQAFVVCCGCWISIGRRSIAGGRYGGSSKITGGASTAAAPLRTRLRTPRRRGL